MENDNNYYKDPDNTNQGGQYNSNNFNQAPEPNKKSGLAIASMVLGIISIIMACCCYPIGIIMAVVGVILGIISIRQGDASSKGFAIAGIITSSLGLVIGIVILIMSAYLTGSGFMDEYLNMLKEYSDIQ